MKFLKDNITSLVIIALFSYIVFLDKNGNGNSVRTPDTVYSKSTEYIQQPTQTVPQYQPIIIESKQPVVIPSQYQLPSDPEALKEFCEDIVKKYLAENKYQDSTILKDSAGNSIGVFRNNDVVSQNMIKSRAPSYTLRFPHTTERLTITKYEEPKRQLFLGPELSGSQTSLVRDIGIGAIYKDKKENLYRFSTGYTLPYKQQYFEISKYWKIQFYETP